MYANRSSNEIWVDLKAKENPLKMERDTGSAESIIQHELYGKKFNDRPLYKTELMLLTYTGKTLF